MFTLTRPCVSYNNSTVGVGGGREGCGRSRGLDAKTKHTGVMLSAKVCLL